MSQWESVASPIAYGELGLKPWEFERLTPREFDLMVEGFDQRQRIEWARTAQLASWMLLPHVAKGKRAPTARTFLGDWFWSKLLRRS